MVTVEGNALLLVKDFDGRVRLGRFDACEADECPHFAKPRHRDEPIEKRSGQRGNLRSTCIEKGRSRLLAGKKNLVLLTPDGGPFGLQPGQPCDALSYAIFVQPLTPAPLPHGGGEGWGEGLRLRRTMLRAAAAS